MSDETHIGVDLASGPDRQVTLVYGKTCECVSHASGGRVAFDVDVVDKEEVVKFTAVHYQTVPVCDACDKPWVKLFMCDVCKAPTYPDQITVQNHWNKCSACVE